VSHIVQVETQVRDPVALSEACRRLGLAEPEQGTARLFSGEVEGLKVTLPGWRYPLVVQPERGTVQFDNFEGHWGDPVELDRLLQAYAVAKARLEARRRGHAVREQTLADGSIRLTITPGGGA
jgi:hypothetical protein